MPQLLLAMARSAAWVGFCFGQQLAGAPGRRSLSFAGPNESNQSKGPEYDLGGGCGNKSRLLEFGRLLRRLRAVATLVERPLPAGVERARAALTIDLQQPIPACKRSV